MKKILILITLTLFAFANDTQIDLLTGDTKLSCEAILCLSSSTRPSECNPSLDRYFSINAKKWKDTVKKRKNFLKLCPVGGADIDDLVFSDLRDNLLPNSDPRQCTAEYLNKQIETNGDEEYYNSSIEYRINPNIPQQCYALFSHSYTALEKPDYVCSGEFYSKLEWKLSAKLKNISYQEWQNLIPQNRHKIDYSDGDGGRYSYYYEKIPFSKTCWIDKE
ncbi:TrbM/KikA/MpfK family conjugal transfer protein [Arcobacter lacus]|uniref:TrbM/KikA/MpfK family conjugal transfer protein n=1 Tax=Arcobacter lacus TaxID=1912876 RepID=UPI0021BAF3AC|nr:TrbM/KikA/MpfK family conjugal transfer protein [Arcobacter lacus]MCT7910707.1 TrbM/KikA/MpfK family conjugal transfer protein [Arcobacter lacus]